MAIGLTTGSWTSLAFAESPAVSAVWAREDQKKGPE